MARLVVFPGFARKDSKIGSSPASRRTGPPLNGESLGILKSGKKKSRSQDGAAMKPPGIGARQD
jgi:hypothetical protein